MTNPSRWKHSSRWLARANVTLGTLGAIASIILLILYFAKHG
jgi:hypothetical protein